MKHIFLIATILLISFSLMSQDSSKEKFLDWNSDVRQYVKDLNYMISLHESGISKRIRLSNGEVFNFHYELNAQEKQYVRNQIKAVLDSINVRVDSIRSLIP